MILGRWLLVAVVNVFVNLVVCTGGLYCTGFHVESYRGRFRIGCIAPLDAVEPVGFSTWRTERCSVFKSTLRLLSVSTECFLLVV